MRIEASVETLEATHAQLEREHAENLREMGVKMPPLRTRAGFNRRALQLICLRLAYRQLVSKEALAAFVRRFEPDSAGDQQARHLAYDGWDVRCSGKAKDKFDGQLVPNGHHALASVEHPAKKFLANRLKRLGRAAATDWRSLQEAYGHRCATCGTLAEGKLEMGHKDPRGTSELRNIIPVCGRCNNWAGDRFVFDDGGRVIALASPAMALSADEQVQYGIWLALRDRFK